ncbi:hypothetical protein GOBAR_AA09338 [Gossypium barbadense]|uniref:sarcosine oxidasee (formaldehyde-forming) n=1 Tax=Gossypium barbadense TaxID=3634 RepID=A0A2P5Y6T2_GOSBA|nr:hypothetical protein GOBAR_AA09338 [Gossypium barbadense]
MGYSDFEFDVIVVGAGVMGSCTAYQLAKRGQKTLLLEQFDFLHHRGSSHGESRTIRATYPEDYYFGLVDESYRLWEQAQSEIGFKVYFKAQQFDMGPSDTKSLLSVIATCRKNAIRYQVLDHREVAERFSGRINIPEDWIGVSCELGGIIKPTKAVSMFQMLAFKNGACLKDNIKVVSINKDASEQRPIENPTTNSTKRKKRKGPESKPAKPKRRKSFIRTAPPNREKSQWVEQRFKGKVDSSKPVITQLSVYSMTPDEDFEIDFLGGEFGKDVVIGGGFSGHGFKMSPAIGRILADLALIGKAKGVELKQFRIARFEENPRGNIKEYEDQVGLLKSTL